ncbi:MAG TPA: hypothetical protein VFA45_22755 [Actinomycetes bacterium]|nr:hypothetical protein [Actinomycetes bacterium]
MIAAEPFGLERCEQAPKAVVHARVAEGLEIGMGRGHPRGAASLKQSRDVEFHASDQGRPSPELSQHPVAIRGLSNGAPQALELQQLAQRSLDRMAGNR